MSYKPIVVQYGGKRFRSKLEAKWAVFLDYLQIQYEYEPRVYNLSNGKGYLPDFYIPSQDVFLEIKPNKELREEDKEKISLFSNDGSIRPTLVVLFGEPEMYQDHYFHVYGCRYQRVKWVWDQDRQQASIQLLSDLNGGDPHHPHIYGAIEHARYYSHIIVDN